MKNSSKPRSADGFTMTELLVVMVIVVVLATISVAVFARVRKSADQMSCISNLRQIGLGIQNYRSDHRGQYPVTWYFGEAGKPWCRAIEPYVGFESDGTEDGNLFRCPSVAKDKHHGWSDYGYNENLGLGKPEDSHGSARGGNVRHPARTVMVGDSASLADGKSSWFFAALQFARGWNSNSNVPHCRHGDKSNLVFLDGHGENLTWEEIERRKEELFGSSRYYRSANGF